MCGFTAWSLSVHLFRINSFSGWFQDIRVKVANKKSALQHSSEFKPGVCRTYRAAPLKSKLVASGRTTDTKGQMPIGFEVLFRSEVVWFLKYIRFNVAHLSAVLWIFSKRIWQHPESLIRGGVPPFQSVGSSRGRPKVDGITRFPEIRGSAVIHQEHKQGPL